MFAVVVIAITALNVRTVLSSDRSYDMNTSTIEAISGKMILLMVEKSEWVEIKCSTGGSGDCYQKRTETIDLHRCRVYCEATGVPKDYCSSFWMGVIDYCINHR